MEFSTVIDGAISTNATSTPRVTSPTTTSSQRASTTVPMTEMSWDNGGKGHLQVGPFYYPPPSFRTDRVLGSGLAEVPRIVTTERNAWHVPPAWIGSRPYQTPDDRQSHRAPYLGDARTLQGCGRTTRQVQRSQWHSPLAGADSYPIACSCERSPLPIRSKRPR